MTNKKRTKVLIICGPTTTGKTDVALYLAKKFDGEIVACDSRQVYKGLDIGTGKYPAEEIFVEKFDGYWLMDGVKVWMYDLVELETQYNVAEYIKDAERTIRDILSKKKLPIVVGGAGLYLKLLTEGLSALPVIKNEGLREELEKLSLQELQDRLQQVSQKRWGLMNNSDRNNKRRLVRYIELFSINPHITTNNDFSLKNDYSILKIGLTAPRSLIYQKVDQRILHWFKIGIVEEVKGLINKGLTFARLQELGLEYAVVGDFIHGDIKSEGDMFVKIMGKLHRYVRNQETWFKKDRDIVWFDITGKNFLQKVENRVRKWYYLGDAEKD